jgi:hypothetical protein
MIPTPPFQWPERTPCYHVLSSGQNWRVWLEGTDSFAHFPDWASAVAYARRAAKACGGDFIVRGDSGIGRAPEASISTPDVESVPASRPPQGRPV